MDITKPIDSQNLTVSQRNALRIGNFSSFADLLVTPINEVARKCKISAQEAKIIYDILYKECPLLQISRLDELESSLEDVFSSGDVVLDQALGGGFRTGMLWEIVGESAAGKTQLALQLSLSVQNPRELGGLSGATCYLTTSSKLPTGRLKQILESNERFSLTDCSLNDVHTLSISTVPILENILTNVLPNFIQQKASSSKPVKLLVIDALTELFHSSDKTNRTTLFDRSKDLNRLSSSLHKIASTHGISIVVLNEVIDRFERGRNEGNTELVYTDKSRWFNTCNSIPGENTKEASLGLVWANQLNARIMLSRTGRRRYLDDTESQHHQHPKKFRSNTNADASKLPPQAPSEDRQPTLIRRLSIIFSSVSPSISLDYVVTEQGVSILPDESFTEDFRPQFYSFDEVLSEASSEAAAVVVPDSQPCSTPLPSVQANENPQTGDEWDRYWEEDETSKTIDWDALELSLTQPTQ